MTRDLLFMKTLAAENPSLAMCFHTFYDTAEARGLVLTLPARPETCSIMLKSRPEEGGLNFGWFGYHPMTGLPIFRTYGIAKYGGQVGEEYLYRLAALLQAEVYPTKNPFYMTVKRKADTGWVFLSIEEVLRVQDQWLALIEATRARFAAA
ncbi:MAG: hypothetical protein NZ578_01190 [Candidatus Binatia bacterium]|nr:hypothetical protein [Candidatus Binatia bacterium]